MSLSTSLRMKIWYDDAAGIPVDITSKVIGDFNIKRVGENANVRPFGAGMDQFIATGIGHVETVTFGGLFKTDDATGLDSMFADRLPEDPDTPTRTLKIDWTGDDTRTTSFETNLLSYDSKATSTTGLTRSEVMLQPTGEINEFGPT